MPVNAVVSGLNLKHILLTTDFSDASKSALPYAHALAFKYGATLSVLHVLPPDVPTSVPLDPMPPLRKLTLTEAQKHMGTFLGNELADVRYSTSIRQGHLLPVIEEALGDYQIDLLVVGTHGYGMVKELLLGSHTEEIVRNSTCPVLTIGPKVDHRDLQALEFRTIVLATDLSDALRNELAVVAAIQQDFNVSVHILHVVHLDAVPGDMTDLLVGDAKVRMQAILRKTPVDASKTEFALQIGGASDHIVKFAREHQADLIIMGAHRGAAAASHAPWSVAHQVVKNATAPVLMIRNQK